MAFTIHKIYKQIFKIWRAKRFELFVQTIQPSRSQSLIDIGGYPALWTSQPPLVAQIDAVNIHQIDFNPAAHPEHNISFLVGNGCCLPMDNGQYDIAFSNSVIEHVGTWRDQQMFADEMRRVGRMLWCQTPARECPIEPHYLAPFVHWLPRSLQRRIVGRLTPWGIISRPSRDEVESMVDTTRLLSRKEMTILFPDCEIMTEFLLPFVPKSYIAVRK